MFRFDDQDPGADDSDDGAEIPRPADGSTDPTRDEDDGDVLRHVTQLLQQMSAGDSEARATVWNAMYGEIRDCAKRQESKGGSKVGLHATELINIAFTKVTSSEGKEWADRRHFVAVAARAMRTAILDHLRRPIHGRRDKAITSFVDEIVARVDGDLLGFYDELEAFFEIDPIMAHALELKALGYSTSEIADQLGMAQRTFDRRFGRARAYLERKLK